MASIIAFELYAGRDRTHRVTCRAGGAVLDITGATITLTVKRSRSDTSPVLTLSNPAEIDVVDAVNGIIDVNFADTLTDGLAGLYVHEIVAVTSTGVELKLAEGPLTILPSF